MLAVRSVNCVCCTTQWDTKQGRCSVHISDYFRDSPPLLQISSLFVSRLLTCLCGHGSPQRNMTEDLFDEDFNILGGIIWLTACINSSEMSCVITLCV